jgi:DNA-binding NtrC family response regulator
MSLQMGPAVGSLLLVDDDAGVRDAIAEYLKNLGHQVEAAADCESGLSILKAAPFHVVVCDVSLPDRDGYHLLEWCIANRPDTSVILLTGYGTIEGAVEAIRLGAFEYLTKPLIYEELSLAVRKALGQRQIVEENKRLRQRLDEKFGLGTAIGRDYKMQRMFDLIESVADTRTTVLILGESGTGKTMTARAIHQLSSRREKPFIEVACGALPDNLLESELFGHVKGSFTGASQDKTGKFLQADGGTLFLDEIATASPSLQVKLLRAIQDREFEPVGGNKTHKVDVRLILATNADLKEAVEKGQFREDLYYRINVISLTQPPLRERIGDIPLLAEHYLGTFREQTGKRVNGFDLDAIRVMQAYRWPGNVRELVNVVERAVVLCRGSQITVSDLPETLKEDPSIRAFHRSGGANLKAALALPERQMILDTLAANHWNRQDTAKMLGINRTTLYKKMKRLDIDIELEMMKARS